MARTAPLPRGTPTFLFTDIEASTRLLQRLGDRYATVRSRHLQLLTEAFEGHGGVVFGTEGDAVFVAFETATGAVAGAIAGQLALKAEPWPDGAEIRVRMGMHTGEVAVVDDDYVGMTVHIAARVAAAGHGGQVLATEVTAGLAGQPPIRDLGRHELKDVGEHRIVQLLAPGLDDEFPALRTVSSRRTNLPAAVDAFIGRSDELDEVLLAIGSNRLVTLTGPGGSGKTRLAMEAARAAVPEFPDGVWFVDLAAVDSADRVVSAAAQALDVQEGHTELATAVEHWIQGKNLLLVLDNCEHLVAGAGAFASRFLARCPQLHILATSRSYLGARGEHVVQTPPLRLPRDGDDPSEILASDAVDLFLTRAAAAAPAFDVGVIDADALAAICRRLDGLPLAIELAAARLRALSLEQLAARLDDRFRLLRSGAQTDVARHQTLAAVVQWSYDLLAPDEQRMFERLGVFPHHFSLEMAEAVTAGPPIAEQDVVDLLSQLLEKSLVTAVRAPDGSLRYQLLETLRAFALERLTESGRLSHARSRLLAWSLSVVEHLEATIRTPDMDDALRGATHDAVTHRAVAQWAASEGRAAEAVRITAMVPLSVHRSERVAEVRTLLDMAKGELAPVHEGHAWAAIGNMSFEVGDWTLSADANRRAAACFEAAGEHRLAGWSRYLLAHSHWGAGELDALDRAVEATIDQFRAAGDEMGLGYSLWIAAMRTADLSRAEELAAEADAKLRSVHVPNGIAHNVEGRGIIALEDDRIDDAARYVGEAIRIFAEYDNLGCAAHALEAAAVVLSTGTDPDPLPVELLVAAERFRMRSGQSHRPWEVRSRGGATADTVRRLDAAAPAMTQPREPDLQAVAALACQALADRRGVRNA